MIPSLIGLLLVALVLYLFWKYVLGVFIKDATAMNFIGISIGIIVGLCLLVYGMQVFHVLPKLP